MITSFRVLRVRYELPGSSSPLIKGASSEGRICHALFTFLGVRGVSVGFVRDVQQLDAQEDVALADEGVAHGREREALGMEPEENGSVLEALGMEPEENGRVPEALGAEPE